MEPVHYNLDGIKYELKPIGDDSLSPHDLHVVRVYQDAEFINDLVELEKEHGTTIEHTIADTGSTNSDKVMSFYEKLANDWSITSTEAAFAYMNDTFNSKRLARVPNEQPMLIDWSSLFFDNRFTVEFNLGALKKSHLDELWVQIEKRQLEMNGGKLKRNRAPENRELIYAIFKARKNKHTFTEIYIDYEKGTLPGYLKQGTQFKDADSLTRYYRKYKP